MEHTPQAQRKFAIATLETLIGNLQAAIDFNAPLELVTELIREIQLRSGDVLTSYFMGVK
jgi:hypothetical protein